MKTMKKFESFFNEEKIVLSENQFSELCQTGYIKYNTGNLVESEIEIPIEPNAFDLLIEGKIVKVYYMGVNYQIALSDIGLKVINHYIETSNIY